MPDAPVTSAPPHPVGPLPATASVAVSGRGLHKVYGTGDTAVHALAGVDVDLEKGKFTAIMGPSGSGKSTLMHCLAGLDAATAGTVVLGNIDLTQLNDAGLTSLRRTQVGFVFQAFNLVPSMTAQDNITLPLRLAGKTPEPQWWDQVIGTLGLSDRLTHRPAELSGGQQQRVAVARALMPRPTVVFADEPTGALDSVTGTELLTFLRTCVQDLGQTIVMVTHDPLAASYADRALMLADGRIVEDVAGPTPDSVLTVLRQLGGAA